MSLRDGGAGHATKHWCCDRAGHQWTARATIGETAERKRSSGEERFSQVVKLARQERNEAVLGSGPSGHEWLSRQLEPAKVLCRKVAVSSLEDGKSPLHC